MQAIDIYRGNLFLFAAKPESSSSQVKKIMGENELWINVRDSQYINFMIGDRAEVFGESYYLNRLPITTKIASNLFEYDITMQSTNHILAKVQYLFLGDDNSLKEGDFSLTGTAADFLKLVVKN